MTYTTRIGWETLRSRSATLFDGTFQAMGFNATPTVPAPLLFPSYILKFVNNSTVSVLISIDGVTPIDVSPSSSAWLYDEGKVGTESMIPACPKGTQIYVQGAAGTGSVYVVSQYIIKI